MIRGSPRSIANDLADDVDLFAENMSGWTRELTCDGQLRWVGPEKGVISLASAAIVNAFWDLWAKMEAKPVWKLLCDMTPEQLVSLVDFRSVIYYYIRQI